MNSTSILLLLLSLTVCIEDHSDRFSSPQQHITSSNVRAVLSEQDDFFRDLQTQLAALNPSYTIGTLSCGYMQTGAFFSLDCGQNAQQLEMLWIYNLRLTSIPASISSLSQSLSYITIMSSELETLGSGFSYLTNLNIINIASNRINSIPEYISLFTGLTFLGFNSNYITKVPDWFGSLSNLSYLNLNENIISNLPDSFRQLTDLTDLDLSNNLLSTIPSYFEAYSNLVYLNLEHNKFTSFPSLISSYSLLEHLALRYNSFTSLPTEIYSLTNLVELYLNNNPDLPGNIDLFKSTRKLERLNISNTLISGYAPEIFEFGCDTTCICSTECTKNSRCACDVYSSSACPEDRCAVNKKNLCVNCLGISVQNICNGGCSWCTGMKNDKACYWCDFSNAECSHTNYCNNCCGFSSSPDACSNEPDCEWCEYDYCTMHGTCVKNCLNLSQEKCLTKSDCLWCSSFDTCLDSTAQCLSCDRFTSSFCPPGCDCPSKSNGTTIIIVICVVCCLAFVLICVVLIFVFRRKQQQFTYSRLFQSDGKLQFDEEAEMKENDPILLHYLECPANSLFQVSHDSLVFSSFGSPLKLSSPATASFELKNICGVDLTVENLFVKGFKETHDFVFTPSSFTIKANEKLKISVELTMKCSAALSPTKAFICCGTSTKQQWCSLCGISAVSELSSLLSYDDIELKSELGRGAFGKVYLGTFKGTEVAVKKYSIFTKNDNEKEANMFSKLHSPYIVTFYGISQTMNAMVIEYCKFGSVEGLYDRKEMSDRMKLLICYDCSLGMNYLHLNGIIHRDLKPENLLIVSFSKDVNTVRAKISDFGTSRFMNRTMKMTSVVGTPSYMAPEVFNNESYGKKSDVYSFGLTAWSIYSKQTPFTEFSNVHTILLNVNEGYRPQLSQDCPLNDLIEQSWQMNPNDRPSFEEISEILKKQIDAM